MDPLTSQPSQERIYRTPAGLHLRMLQIGEVVQRGDFTWLKQGSVEEEDPILAVAGVGRTVTAEMGNNYYRPIQGAADGEAVPEAPAEGSPPLPKQIGFALAMRVLQSDLYAKLDDEERGECDAFIKAGAAPSVTMGGDKDALIAELAGALRMGVDAINGSLTPHVSISLQEIEGIRDAMDAVLKKVEADRHG